MVVVFSCGGNGNIQTTQLVDFVKIDFREHDLLAQTQPPPRPVAKGQTIQLAAKSSASEAEAYWSNITSRFPELERYEKAIIPAVVGSKQYYRLRVTGPGARDMCTSLKRSGADCFPV